MSGIYKLDDLIGISSFIKDLKKKIEKLSKTNSTILIYGESGTGKEIVAQVLHQLSDRNKKEFVALNCGSIPIDLAEAELFGYEKGAFTGALNRGIGKLKQADGGTLFLDEINSLPLSIQVKLLRFLEDKTYYKLGGGKEKSDVRIIAATNKNLEGLVREGLFREDLYWRLNVFTINLLPLRERKEDIPILLNYFIEKYNKKYSKKVKKISDDLLEILMKYSWPGNVRELQNFVEREVFFAESNLIDHIPDYIEKAVKNDEKIDFKTYIKQYFKRLLRRYDVKEAIEISGITELEFKNYCRDLGIKVSVFKEEA